MKIGSIVCFVFLLLIQSSSHAYTHVHPVPSLPVSVDLYKVFDVFSENLIAQLHATLFKQENNIPTKNLVESFEVGRDQLQYVITLKKLRFHNDQKLINRDVKTSLESAIRHRSPGFEKLSVLVGYNEFVRGINSDIKGIMLGGNDLVVILSLSRPCPLLTSHLTEFRFSIIPSNGDFRVGLGPYRLRTLTDAEVVIERVDSSRQNAPDLVIYKKAGKEEALIGFLNQQYHDLFSYPIDIEDAKKVGKNGKNMLIYTPRTYLLSLNPRMIIDKAQRSDIFNGVDISDLINHCYPNNELAHGVIPPGFLGHMNKPIKKTTAYSPPKSYKIKGPFRVAVANGVGNESCVVEKLTNFFKKNHAEVSVVETSDALDGWMENKIHAIFLYVESENTLDFFQFYNPSSNFTFGVLGDVEFQSLIDDYNIENNPIKRAQVARSISYHVHDLSTVLPFFHPKQFLIYSNRYENIDSSVKSTTFIEFGSMRLDK